MFGLSYLKLAIAGTVVLALATSHIFMYRAGKTAVLDKLKDDRITILKDGSKIDEKVLGADDSALCVILGGCVSD